MLKCMLGARSCKPLMSLEHEMQMLSGAAHGLQHKMHAASHFSGAKGRARKSGKTRNVPKPPRVLQLASLRY
eukprot:5637095-Amphidinium_carterae.1